MESVSVLTRRTLLKALAAAGGAAALPAASFSATSGGADAAPRRLVLFFTPCGTLVEDFFPRSAQVTDSLLLAPLAGHASDLLVLDGLRLAAAEAASGDPHQTGIAALLTGRPGNEGEFCGGAMCISGRSGWASGISIDQWLAQAMLGTTALPSLELGVRLEGSNNRHRMSFGGSDLPIAPDGDPRSVFTRLFGQVDDAEARDAVLAAVARRTERLRDASPVERPLFDAHLDGLARLRDGLARLPDAAASCEHPDQPPALDAGLGDNYEQIGALQMELAVAALRCDMTRITSILWSGATSKLVPSWLDPDGDPGAPFNRRYSTGFHEYTHKPYDDLDKSKPLETRNKLRAMYRWYARQLARFLDLLAATPDVDGTRLLDNTMVLWCSELSEPSIHSFERMPFVLAGGGNFLETGRYVDYQGEYHNALLATLAVGMGADVVGYGHPDYVRAPLWGLLR